MSGSTNAIVREAAKNSRLMRLVVAYGCGAVTEWAVYFAVLVFAQDRGGSSAAGWAALGLVLPMGIIAPFVGRLTDGPRPLVWLTSVLIAQSVALVVATVMAVTEAPLILVVVSASIAVGGISFIRPAYSVITPSQVRTARELTASNLFAGFADSGCVLVGPLLATALLTIAGPPLVLAVGAMLALVGAISTATLLGEERAGRQTERQPPAPMMAMMKAAISRPSVRVLLGVLFVQQMVMGAIDLVFVVFAVDELGIGDQGAGLLSVSFGVGAICSGFGSSVLIGRPRLAPAIAVMLAGTAASLLVMGLFPTVAVAVIGFVMAGFCRSLLDVTARMLLQRSSPAESLAPVFGMMEILTGVGLMAGTGLAQTTIAIGGAPLTLIVFGIGVAGVLTLVARKVWSADDAADVPIVAIRLLRSVSVFQPLPPLTIEAIARSSQERQFATDEVLMREGDPGDGYFAIASGMVAVTVDGREIGRYGRGSGVGEIALLADVPRTATVTALEPTGVLAIEREPFMEAVTGHAASEAAAWRLITAIEPELQAPDPRSTS